MEDKRSTVLSRFAVALPQLVVFFVPALFLIVKGSANTGLMIFSLFAIYAFCTQSEYFLTHQDKTFWITLLALLSPFATELVTQIAREGFVLQSLDGPSRSVLAACSYVFLTRYERPVLRQFGLGCLFGIVATGVSIFVFKQHFWGSRAATYFVDPNTLACYTVAMYGVAMFMDLKTTRWVRFLIKALMTAIVAFVVIVSQSRGGLLSFLFVFLGYNFYLFRGALEKFLLSLSAVAIVLTLFSFSSFEVIERLRADLVGLSWMMNYEAGQWSSFVQRVVLLQVDWELIKLNLFLGTEDGVLPPFEDLKERVPMLTEEIYQIKTLAGSHAEFMAQLVRKGVILGSIALWGLFVYPLWFIFQSTRSVNGHSHYASLMFCAMVGSLVVAASSIQIFNLKMTSSFYFFSLAILFSQIKKSRQSRGIECQLSR